jgi:hypothetical protein
VLIDIHCKDLWLLKEDENAVLMKIKVASSLSGFHVKTKKSFRRHLASQKSFLVYD